MQQLERRSLARATNERGTRQLTHSPTALCTDPHSNTYATDDVTSASRKRH
jgi:hypothetical protein